MKLCSGHHRWCARFSLGQVRENRGDYLWLGYHRQHFEVTTTVGAHADINVVDPSWLAVSAPGVGANDSLGVGTRSRIVR